MSLVGGFYGFFDGISMEYLWNIMVNIYDNDWLVVEPTPPKHMNVSWDDELPNIRENKKCSKPPTRSAVGISFLFMSSGTRKPVKACES